jgi:hypothetical protein
MSASFDLAGLIGWGLDKAIAHAEEKTQLPLKDLGNLVKPLANGFLGNLGIQAIEVDPIMLAVGKVVWAGMERQKQIELARRGQESQGEANV